MRVISLEVDLPLLLVTVSFSLPASFNDSPLFTCLPLNASVTVKLSEFSPLHEATVWEPMIRVLPETFTTAQPNTLTSLIERLIVGALGVGVGASGLSPEHDAAKSRASDNNVGTASVIMFLNAEVVCLLI